jgi:uncharacterized small protein (DUF1192 family)
LGINGKGMVENPGHWPAAGSGEARPKKRKHYIISAASWEKRRTEEGMDEADLEPRRKPAQPKDLTLMGIEELEGYIAELEAEIARVRVEITAKLGQRRGAEALFKR